MNGILLHAVAALLYAGLAAHFWRTRWRAAAPRPPGLASWERAAILAPLAVHTWLIYQALFLAPDLRFGFGQALSVTLWLAVLIYWFESLFVNLEGMQGIVLGAAAVCVLLPGLFPGLTAPPDASGVAFRAHLALAMLAYSLFTIGAMHALLMALIERRLHRDSLFGGRRDGEGDQAGRSRGLLEGPLATLPPLLTLDRKSTRLNSSHRL